MKIKIKYNEKIYLIIEYENNEYQKIKKILEQLNLEIKETQNGFGKKLKLMYYRERNTELLNYIHNTFKDIESDLFLIDDINRDFFENGTLNICFFRIIPEEQKVYIPLNKFLTVRELNEIVKTIKKIYEKLINIVLEKDIEIK